ncbi:MAG: macB [Deltaproteobacteria bacterium]|nr:macB [Deltaproteobacteria bacterium]
MPAPLVEARDLWKVYELGDMRVEALRGVTLSIDAGEAVAVMGASGSGKSTFMNLLGCLDQPTRGSLRFAEHEILEASADERAEIRSREIGFVFQSFNLIPRTSAIENVELPLVYAGVSAVEQESRAREALRAVGLAGREHHTPSQLSGGQQQRVAIARALVNRPRLLLADEPTGNLDTRSSQEIMEIFQRLQRESGITLVVVTHERDIATYLDRVITFRDGEVISDLRQTAVRVEASA